MRISSPQLQLLFTLALCSALIGCGGGGGSDAGGDDTVPACNGECASEVLSAAEVTRILGNGVASARKAGVAGTFAVIDRVGNVLAVYQMPGARTTTTISSNRGVSGGLEGLTVPATLAAISKAGTGAYLSSQGNAFSTRTASQIIQENFNPGEKRQPGGPLFGVQFSQLLCSDVMVLPQEGSRPSHGAAPRGPEGPHPLPLGLAADPGGLPLYKNGDMVGGIGVELDGVYSLDLVVADRDNDIEEQISLAASQGFEAPQSRTAARMSVGKYLRYTDSNAGALEAAEAPIDLTAITAVPPFFAGTLREGARFGEPSSGVARTEFHGIPAAVLTDASGAVRFPTKGGRSAGTQSLTAAEVDALLHSSLLTAYRSRAAIRRPLDSRARVSIWVVDRDGAPLGFIRSEDAPVFGIDVALQKARTAAFFSRSDARDTLNSHGFGGYTARADSLLGIATFSDGTAFTSRTIGNLARPFFPDGINGNAEGPLALPYATNWSPFNTGLQLDLVFGNLGTALGLFGPVRAIPASCAATPSLANGMQLFPGSVPLYRGAELIGAIGVSGDGIDQDDLVAFYGSSRRGLNDAGYPALGDGTLGYHPPRAIRADTLSVSPRLRFVSCPEAPFIGSNDQNVCEE